MAWIHRTVSSGSRRRLIVVGIGLLILSSIHLAIPSSAVAGPECTKDPTGLIEWCSTTTNNTSQDVGTARNFCAGTDGPCPGSDPDEDFGVLHRGDRTPPHEDWDAFFVPAGCEFRGNIDKKLDSDVSFVIFASASRGIWHHVHNDEHYQINQITCSPSVDPAVRIVNTNSQLCMVARNTPGENAVIQYPCAYFADQRWQLLDNGNNVFQIVNRTSSKCVATRGTGESHAVATTCGVQWADQLWRREFDPAWNAYRFRNLNSQLCLVARGTSAETRLLQSTCGNWADQLWTTPAW